MNVLVLVLSLLKLSVCYEQLTFKSFVNISSVDTGRLSLNERDELNHFKHFNITRTPGSVNSRYIQNYIIDHFASLNTQAANKWEVEVDSFETNGFNFSNVIASKSPQGLESPQFLVLAAHFDSLIRPQGFIGAIDSAISCGILLDIAESLSGLIDTAYTNEQADVGIKLVFFDGEEAIESWTAADSIYGSKHLHSEWSKTNKIKNIELFVLLDLLGASDINYVPSYFPVSHDHYNDLSSIERRLEKVQPHLFPDSKGKFLAPEDDKFVAEFRGYVEDDHIPFMRSGVPILHLIPHIFPAIWHTMDDNFNNVDLVSIKRWNTLLRTFVLEYLDIDEV